eukprot:3385327-Amphidinium_carterae.1
MIFAHFRISSDYTAKPVRTPTISKTKRALCHFPDTLCMLVWYRDSANSATPCVWKCLAAITVLQVQPETPYNQLVAVAVL